MRFYATARATIDRFADLRPIGSHSPVDRSVSYSHAASRGHDSQFGSLAVQTDVPKSMSAWRKTVRLRKASGSIASATSALRP